MGDDVVGESQDSGKPARWILPTWMTLSFAWASGGGAFAVWLGLMFLANGTESDFGDSWFLRIVNSAVYMSLGKYILVYLAVALLVTFVQERVARRPAQSARATRITGGMATVAKISIIGVAVFLVGAIAVLSLIAVVAGL